MDISWIEAIIYGMVSGLTEFMPVSSQAHQLILRNLFGCYEIDSVLNVFVRIGMLTGLMLTSGNYIGKLFREYRMNNNYRRRRRREVNFQSVCDLNFIKLAIIPMLLSLLLYSRTIKWEHTIPIVAVFLLLNGVILYIPMYLARGNKDSRHMSALDSILFGVASALSILPGVSRIGAGSSVAIVRGAAPQHAYKWSLILSVPALLALLCFDIVAVFGAGVVGADFVFILKCIVSGICAHLGATLSITLMKSLTNRAGISGFSYYCWGAALFAFILYLY